MKRSFFVLSLITSLVVFVACGPGKQNTSVEGKKKHHRLMFYNVENLFDTQDDPLKKDEEFTPEGDKHWTYDKYEQKLNNIAKVTIALSEGQVPDIIGFCELENRKVLEDLIAKTGLSHFGYDIVHKESPDGRGIDVGLIYKDSCVKPLNYQAIPVRFEEEDARPTRDILYFKALIKEADTLHFFVNHWPSRWGGEQKSRPKRVKAASALKLVVDSIRETDPKANIIITGDFNDNPNNVSLAETLGAQAPGGESFLKNLSWHYQETDARGTLKYKGNWDYFDQWIVSSALMDQKGLETDISRSKIFYGTPENEFLLEVDDRYQGMQPNRTYWGKKFHGGFSDHLPVYLDLYMIGD